MRRWWAQVLVVMGTYQAYRFLRIAARGSPETSLDNAFEVADVEQALGLLHEQTVQDFFLGWEPSVRFFDAYHGTAHFVAVGLALVLLWRHVPERYRFWRNVFGWLLALGLIGFALYPLTPPRLMPPPFHFVDTAIEIGGFGPVGRETGVGGGGNEFAAMPSLHAGWSAWVLLALWPLARSWPGRGLLVLHVLVMHMTIVATAKHWVLDAPGGWAALALAVLIESGRRRLRSGRRAAPAPGSATG